MSNSKNEFEIWAKTGEGHNFAGMLSLRSWLEKHGEGMKVSHSTRGPPGKEGTILFAGGSEEKMQTLVKEFGWIKSYKVLPIQYFSVVEEGAVVNLN